MIARNYHFCFLLSCQEPSQEKMNEGLDWEACTVNVFDFESRRLGRLICGSCIFQASSPAYFGTCQVSFDAQGVSQLPVETILAFAEQLLGPTPFGLGGCDTCWQLEGQQANPHIT